MSTARKRPIVHRLADTILSGGVTEYLGAQVLRRCATFTSIFAILSATVMLACRPGTWTPPVRAIFARQLLFTSVDAIFLTVRFGAAVGILLIVQAALWIDTLGVTTDVIAPMLWRAIVREIAPLMACMVVIGRSGIAISTELAMMLVNGEIEVLDSQGIDPMTCLVMPRILSIIISVFCLAVILATTMIVTGYVIGWSVGSIRLPWSDFLQVIIREFTSLDLLFFVPKTILAGAFAGAICCIDGLNIRGSVSDVPRVSSRSGIRALTAVFGVSAVLSLLIYGRILVFKIV
ncbi:ABC transporter permease [Rubripirellula amarantea]|uniref:Putative phospholipid ABC transporter permease protein MlaE n=1 Tax=Rubripirellula amarantea TaxID=2527999 RepID=A0A5C5WJV3_9BACT|nr:ABC transporter permease [Rubripirellula amarantea]MDA8744766.1 ABC transporter permease [Rubripirellula amarantea]TWT50419.1 putative phospholipid ABC transporter permease protein MlaE [Rubripirellula amarantea]